MNTFQIVHRFFVKTQVWTDCCGEWITRTAASQVLGWQEVSRWQGNF